MLNVCIYTYLYGKYFNMHDFKYIFTDKYISNIHFAIYAYIQIYILLNMSDF